MICPVVAIEAPALPPLDASDADVEAWGVARSAWAGQLREQLDLAEACWQREHAETLRLADEVTWWKREAKRPRVGLVVGAFAVGLAVGVGAGLVGE